MNATYGRKFAPAVTTLVFLFLTASSLCAQAVSAAPAKRTTDIAVSYTAEHANPVGGGGNFWLQGGSVEMGVSVWRGLAVVGNFTGTHTSSAGPQNVSLGLMAYTFGPRYRWRVPPGLSPKGLPTSVFGEAMIGGVKGFDSIFPSSSGSTSVANALAIQVGFGVDVKLKPHFDLRPVELSWVRMQLPNSTSNVQNDLRISTGIVVRY